MQIIKYGCVTFMLFKGIVLIPRILSVKGYTHSLCQNCTYIHQLTLSTCFNLSVLAFGTRVIWLNFGGHYAITMQHNEKRNERRLIYYFDDHEPSVPTFEKILFYRCPYMNLVKTNGIKKRLYWIWSIIPVWNVCEFLSGSEDNLKIQIRELPNSNSLMLTKRSHS